MLFDERDLVFIEAFKAQPPDAIPIHALRASFRAVYDRLTAEEWSAQLEGFDLIVSVPDVRRAMLDQFAGMIQQVAELAAERAGRRADEFDVRVLAGAVIGVMMSVVFTATGDPTVDWVASVDAALARLETGSTL